MRKIMWPRLAADDLLFSSLAPCFLLQFLCNHVCPLEMLAALCESESVCRHNLAYSFISLFLRASPPSVSSTLCDSPSACTSTSPLPLILSMVTPLTPISVKYTSKAHTYSELSITCMSACLNNGLCARLFD